MSRLILPVLALSLLSVGCVSMKKYRALETSLKSTEATLQERDATVLDLSARIKELEDESARLGQKAEALRASLDEAQAREANLLADKGQLAANMEAMKVALRELEDRKNAAEERIRSYRDLLSRFQKLIDAGKLKVKFVEGRMVVELATDILFASGSAELSKEGEAAIVEVSKVLASIPNREFQVAGHTDSDPIRTKFPSNWELAAARAMTVVKAMTAAGMPANRVSAASYGEFKPVASNGTAAGKASNRRIEITIVADLSELPGNTELNEAAKGK